jgi:poly(A) polymerase
LKKFLRLPAFDEHLELHRLDCLGSHRDLGNYEFMRRMESELDEEDLRPPRLITGDDLIAAGYEPGRRFQTILAEVENAQLEGRLNNRDEALAFVEQRFERPTGRGREGG